MARLGRIEFRASSDDLKCGALIEVLETECLARGSKKRFLKDRLLAGFNVVRKELDWLIQEPNPIAALNEFGKTIDPYHLDVLRLLLPTHKASSVGGGSTVPVVHAEPKPVAPPMPVRDEVRVAETKVLDATPIAAVASVDEPPLGATAPKKHDWSSFQGLAGVKKGS